jgi:integrase
LAALPRRERILVFLDVSAGLRQSELFGLQWQDIDFEIGELRVTRSVVGQVVGTCKTEASHCARNLYLFVPARKFFHRRKCLIRNGGDDETRTRDLCRDSGPLLGFTTTYKTAGTAKGRLSR